MLLSVAMATFADFSLLKLFPLQNILILDMLKYGMEEKNMGVLDKLYAQTERQFYLLDREYQNDICINIRHGMNC